VQFTDDEPVLGMGDAAAQLVTPRRDLRIREGAFFEMQAHRREFGC
jgi:hypothetical protein